MKLTPLVRCSFQFSSVPFCRFEHAFKNRIRESATMIQNRGTCIKQCITVA